MYGGGLRVKTTIDLKLQKIARDAIAKVLPPSIGPTAALVALDPHTGAVLAMVGGRNYHKSQFNLATQGERQPGSAFKPFVLAAALKGHLAVDDVRLEPITIDADGRVWQVNNYEGEYLGPIDLSKAIAYSDNSVFAQLTKSSGRGTWRRRHGARRDTPLHGYFSIGLGGEWNAARHGARVRGVRERRQPHRRRAVRRRAACRRVPHRRRWPLQDRERHPRPAGAESREGDT